MSNEDSWNSGRLAANALRVSVRTSGAALPKPALELHHGDRLLASGRIAADSRWTLMTLHAQQSRIPDGHHTLTIRSGEHVLMRRRVAVG